MENIRIRVTENNTIVVVADTKRFGKDAIMYECRSFMHCCEYIRCATRKDHFSLSGMPMVGFFTDVDGKTMPREMWVHNFR